MKRKISMLVSVLLLVAAIILLCLSVLNENSTNLYLSGALLCTLSANALNVLRARSIKKALPAE